MPKDYFLTGRQLFGFLAPGGAWIGCFLLLSDRDLGQFLGDMTVARAVVVLAVSFIVGLATAPLSFGFTETASKILERLICRVCRKDSIRRDQKHEAALVQHIRLALRDRYPEAHYVTTMSDAEVPKFCKRVLLETTTRFARELDEIEAEINLRTGFSAPIFFFGALLVYRGWPLFAGALLGFGSILLAGVLVKRIASMRRYERRLWCELFLAAQLAPKLGSDKAE